MNRLPILRRLLALLVAGSALSSWAASSIYIQNELLFTTPASSNGVNKLPFPGSSLPVGTGDAFTGNSPVTPNQFRGGIVYGGVTKQAATNALITGNFAANATTIDWPRSTVSGQVASILRAAVGGPFLSHGFDYYFGQQMSVPLTDLSGVKLASPETYWHSTPVFRYTYTTTSPTQTIVTNDPGQATDYYFSPHKPAVYATKAGQVAISWRTEFSSITTQPTGYNEGVTHLKIGGYYYPITNTVVLVSGIPVQTPRKMYWTKGDYEKTGKLVVVPAGVKSINFVYNNLIPAVVPESEVVIGGSIKANTGGTNFNNGNVGAFTSTIRVENGFIAAYNKEGRIFMELLGDATGDNTKRQLGVEIVDVQRDAVPDDVTIELGERVTAFPNNLPSDAALQPSPVVQLSQSFAYQRNINSQGDMELYATRVTHELTDYQAHWMEQSIGGLRWPYRFVRYTFVWPDDAAKYSHYVRSVVADEAAAAETAIKLPSENVPVLEDQDPSNNNSPRAKLTEDARFYTYLDETQPTLRALVRYSSRDRVAFERVFSWLDVNLKQPSLLTDSLATTLRQWNMVPPFSPEDFKNLASLAAKINAATDPLSAFLKARLAPTTLEALANYLADSNAANTALLKAAFASDFNLILNNNSFFDPALVWTSRESVRNWTGLASSASGSNLVASVASGFLYTSTNAGASWTQRGSSLNWKAVASSANGTNLVAAVGVGFLYTSTDAGVTWTQRDSSRNWLSVASSTNGLNLAALVDNGRIYTSVNGGTNWTAREINRPWQSIASSANGTRLLAAVRNGQLYASSDAGVSWIARESTRDWRSVAMSSDGTRAVAVANNGFIYISSDAGVNWTSVGSAQAWSAVTSSGDGTRLAATVSNGQIYTSTDAGATWTARESNRNWLAIASSFDGIKLAAAGTGTAIYTARPMLDGADFGERRINLENSYPTELFHGQSVVTSDTLTSARVIQQTVLVGDRINAPYGEIGSDNGAGYMAGYLNQAQGTSVSVAAYLDPLRNGFVAANQSSIIPVNAIPGKNNLEVWWFRKNPPTSLRDETLGFIPTYWPSVIGRYTLAWPSPTNASTAKIILASNHGSGPLNSFQTAGHLYFQNIKGLAGYNPNEEHALLQGGRAWALREDLNVTTGTNYSSEPFVLLEYIDADQRPSMTAFSVQRESATEKFNYTMDAGLILQAPMPLPLMEKAFPPTAPGQIPHTLSAEVARRDVSALDYDVDPTNTNIISARVSLMERPLFHGYDTLVLQKRADQTKFLSLYVTNIDYALNALDGVLSSNRPKALEAASPANFVVQPPQVTRVRYAVSYANPAQVGLTVGKKVLVSNPDAEKNWYGSITFVKARTVVTNVAHSSYIEVNFGSGSPQSDDDALAATVLILEPKSKAALAAQFSATEFNTGWQVAYEKMADAASGAAADVVARDEFYNQITFQDRKGDIWIYRGPHSEEDLARRSMQFYYKTLDGFWFPTDKAGNALGFNTQPPVGTITPYLRAVLTDDPISGTKAGPNNTVVASDTALGITYNARWPATAPVLQMAETLTVPKRGLPAMRGQTSLEVLYQQSVYLDPAQPSVVLHDPTAAKKFPMANTAPDGSSEGGLNKMPSSIQTSLYRGKTYFPRLAPHLVDRFYFDPNDSKNGSLIFKGVFKAEVLGESYLQPNFISANDIDALRALCDSGDPQKQDWDEAIDNEVGKARLTFEQETFYPNPAKPGTFTSTIDINGQPVHQAVFVHAPDLAEIKHSDTAVDSYALTSTGPGTGYVTVIAGQGVAFTPSDEPVSVKIIQVVDTLYRGEVKVIVPSNPLGEKVTMQQIIDLAGKVDDFDFQWWIAAPVDGFPPPVYGNTARNLMFSGSLDPWHHLRYPLTGENALAFGKVGFNPAASRLASDIGIAVAPVSVIPFTEVATVSSKLAFAVEAETASRLTTGNYLLVRTKTDQEISAIVSSVTVSNATTSIVTVESDGPAALPSASNAVLLYERIVPTIPQSVAYREFSLPSDNTYSQYYLSLDVDDALGVKVYVDGTLVVTANLGDDDTATGSAPSGFAPAPLPRVYPLAPQYFAGGSIADGMATHRVLVELFSTAIPGVPLRFNCQVDAYQSVDLVEAPGSQWLKLDAAKFPDKVRTILGENADVRALSDNYVIMRYKAKDDANYPANSKNWSQWTDPALAEGWIKRVLAGINPFNQRATDLFNNTVNTDANILTSAGKRWEGDIALNLESINDYGLIEIYETVLRRGKDLSINAGISYDPANDALLLAAGYLSDLYSMLGNEARSDAANPTIGIGTKDSTYGDVATALFSFKGQLPTLLEEELALLRGRDDFLQPGVRVAPVYNRLIWNYTRGIDSGEVIYALNYNILDQNNDGRVDAADAAKLYPQGHGDAYGHYLTALKGYYSLLIDKDFAWVPRIEAVNILGKPVSVDYQDERKFASAAAAVARTGRQIFDLTWRRDFIPGNDIGWSNLAPTRDNTTQIPPTHRKWGVDHWAARTGEGSYINWAMGNSILPPTDPNPNHEGIQKVDRTTVPELQELALTAGELQTAMDNAEGHLTPLGLAAGSLAFDINPNQVTGADPKPHFEQLYQRALVALNNAVASFDDAKDVTRLMRSEQDSLAELQAAYMRQEQAYTNSLIELYGTPYPDDVGPGKLYRQGYAGPDLLHYNYVETETIEAPGVYTPNEPDYVAKIDIQQLNSNWSYINNLPRTDLDTGGPVDGSSSDLVIVNLNDPKYEKVDPATGKKLYYIPYAFGSHGFFDKPKAWTSSRQSPGKIQQGISELIQAHDRMYYALAAQCESDKQDLDKAVQLFRQQVSAYRQTKSFQESIRTTSNDMASRQADYDVANKWLTGIEGGVDALRELMEASVPDYLIAGLAISVPVGPVVHPVIKGIFAALKYGIEIGDAIGFTTVALKNKSDADKLVEYQNNIDDIERNQNLKAAVVDLGAKLKAVQGDFQVINEKLRIYDDTKRKYASLVAEGDRLQQEREITRQRSAAIIQGFRTRDAAFRIFRNEKLERYKALFDLAARYAYLAANAYDYETGLLNTDKGRAFINRIVNSRALGVVKNGEPQFAGSNQGDPGLSSVLGEMKADWDVLKGRLGFNNPTAYGTTFSLRMEKNRILPGAEGADAWKDVLVKSKRSNILEDPDVKRYCMQVTPSGGLPVPGLVLEFETTIADGYNFFGQPVAGFDHSFDSSAFATKIFGAGIAFEGYIGMDNPVANSGAVAGAGGNSPSDPNLSFLNPNALGATPGVYLIPVGVDSMRSPALGDSGTVRSWNVDDVTIPLPFNIGGSDFSTKALYQTADSLTEPLFGIRKHPSFRPVSTTAAFTSAIYGSGNALQRSQFTNTRLIGRSVWNSKWKLVIPGNKMLHDSDEAVQRFINTVTDVKLHLVTYSYSGN